jgi:hypothetical protein
LATTRAPPLLIQCLPSQPSATGKSRQDDVGITERRQTNSDFVPRRNVRRL